MHVMKHYVTALTLVKKTKLVERTTPHLDCNKKFFSIKNKMLGFGITPDNGTKPEDN